MLACSSLKRAYRDLLRDRRAAGALRAPAWRSQAVLAARLAARKGHFFPPTCSPRSIATLEPLGPDEDGVVVDVALDPEAQVREGAAPRLGLRAEADCARPRDARLSGRRCREREGLRMASAEIIDGKALRGADCAPGSAAEVAELRARHGVVPGLAVVLVGDDPASEVYVRNKGRQTVEAGMHSEEHRLDAGGAARRRCWR